MFFKKKKNYEMEWKSVPYGPFLIQVPALWEYEINDEKINAKNGEEIRLTVSSWSADTNYKDLTTTLESLRNLYAESGFNPSSEITTVNESLYQTLEINGESCCIIGTTEKRYENDLLILNFVFNTNTQEDLDKNTDFINHILKSIVITSN